MKRSDLIKGFLIRPIMELLKKEYDIKSPTPTFLFVNFINDKWIIIYKHNKMEIDFTDNEIIQNIIEDIKNKPEYEKVWLQTL